MQLDLPERTFRFGVSVIALVRRLPRENAAYVIGRQLIRSATSVSANIEEAQAAVSRADFGNKIGIALKEARESKLWLRFLEHTQISTEEKVRLLIDESTQISKILGSISKKISSRKTK